MFSVALCVGGRSETFQGYIKSDANMMTLDDVLRACDERRAEKFGVIIDYIE